MNAGVAPSKRRGGSLKNATGWLPPNAGVAPSVASPHAPASVPQDDCPAHMKPKLKSGDPFNAKEQNPKLQELGLIVDCRKKLKAPNFAPDTTAKQSGGKLVHPSFGLPA